MKPRGLKLVALRLAGIHMADRRWLLARLHASVRDALQTELTWLDSIAGTDTALFRDALQAAETRGKHASSRFDLSAQWNEKLFTNDFPPQLAAALQTMTRSNADSGANNGFAAHVKRAPLMSIDTVEE